jgi:hypothetical protein
MAVAAVIAVEIRAIDNADDERSVTVAMVRPHVMSAG